MSREPIRPEDSGRDNLSTYERCARLIEKYAPFYIQHGGGIISGTSKPRKKKIVKASEGKSVASPTKPHNAHPDYRHGDKPRRRRPNP
jgi:hypothetical protein